MRRRFFGGLCYLTCALFMGCHVASSGTLSRVGVYQKTTSPMMNVEASVNGSSTFFRDWRAVKLELGERPRALGFSNPRLGWVGGGGGSFYRTTNGGETWQPMRIDLPPGSQVVSASFINDSLGWVVVLRYGDDYLDVGSVKALLLRTNDGGRNRQEQYTGDALEIRRVLFKSESEGWAIGSRTVRRPTIQSEYFVLHTTDQGKHWIEVSGSLNRTVADSEGKVQDAITDIRVAESGVATLLTTQGRIFETTNGGQSWRQVEEVPTDFRTTRLVYAPDNRPRVVDRGLTQKNAEGKWTSYIIKNLQLMDAVFLSDTQVLACGAMRQDKSGTQVDARKEGVILYSGDGGRNWAVVYRNDQVQSINALSRADRHNIWAVGENGLLLRSHS